MLVGEVRTTFDKLQFVAAATTCDLVSASDKLKFVEPRSLLSYYPF